MFWVRKPLHTVNDTLLMKWTLTRTLYLSIFRWALGTCIDYYCRHKCAHQHNRRSKTRRITTLYSSRIYILSTSVKRHFVHTFFSVFDNESYSNLLSIISVLWFAHTITLIIWFVNQFGTHIILWFFFSNSCYQTQWIFRYKVWTMIRILPEKLISDSMHGQNEIHFVNSSIGKKQTAKYLHIN